MVHKCGMHHLEERTRYVAYYSFYRTGVMLVHFECNTRMRRCWEMKFSFFYQLT